MAGRGPRSHTPWRAAIESVHQCDADVIRVAIAMIATNSLLRQSTDPRTSGAIVRPSDAKDHRPRRTRGKEPKTRCARAQLRGCLVKLRTAPEELWIDGVKIDQAEALEKRRHHGFALQSIDDFSKMLI